MSSALPKTPSPPPAYSVLAPSSSTLPEPQPQHQPAGMPSAFGPPSPSSNPHLNTTFGPTPHQHLFGPTPIQQQNQHLLPYSYYDPRSPHSMAQADTRARWRFVGGVMWAILVWVFLSGLFWGWLFERVEDGEGGF